MNEADLLLVMGASFSNHTGIYPGQPIIQVDFDPMQLGKFHPVDGARLGRDRRSPPSCLRAGSTAQPATDDQRGAVRGAGRSGAAEKASRAGDDRGHGVNSAVDLRGPERQIARRRGDRGRRRQQHLLVRPLLRVPRRQRGADVRLPRLDRLRLPGGDRRLGGDRRGAPDRCGHRRRRLRPVHGRDPDRRQARDEHHPRARSTTASSGRSPRSSGRASGTSGRPSSTIPTSPSTPESRAPLGFASPSAPSSITRCARQSPTRDRRWSR